MKLSVLKSISKSSFLVLIGALILSLNSCGLVSNVREQGDSKSWVVTGKEIKHLGSVNLDTQQNLHNNWVIKSDNEPINVNTLVIAPEEKCNHSEDGLLVKREIPNIKFNKNSSTLGLLKLGTQRCGYNGKLLPNSALKKTKNNQKSNKLSKEHTGANSKKNKAIFFALMSTLSFIIAFFMTATGSDILVGLFFVGAVVLLIVSFIQMTLEPEISAIQAVLTMLLNILNIILGLIDLVLWAFMGAY
jgi:hypothetical protein